MAERRVRSSTVIPSEGGGEIYAHRFRLATIAVGLLFLLLAGRFWFLQLYHCPSLKKLSEKNSIRTRVLAAPRGMILDRAGRIIADNRPSYTLSFTAEDSPDPGKTLTRLTEILKLSPEELETIRCDMEDNPPFVPLPIRKGLTFEELVLIESEKFWLPGIIVEVSPRRWYVYETLAAHLLGYMGEVGPDELKTLRPRGYRLRDVVGRSGLESAFEEVLRGEAGGLRLEIDASGREVKKLAEKEPIPGLNLELTIDLELQQQAEELIEGKGLGGVVIMMDPRNGEIIAMTSRPTFNPNRFAGGILPEHWQEILASPGDPLEHRAIRGQYPPASTFKLITALAALEEHVITPEQKINCGGRYRLGRRWYRCWRRWGHGKIDLHRAIAESCDVYFYRLGHKLGVDRIAETARSLGLGAKTGIEISGEKTGLIPTSEWKLKMVGEPWQGGENLSIAIGQGYLLVTPLQLLASYAQFAMGGKAYEPHLVRRVLRPDGQTEWEYLPKIHREREFDPHTLEILKSAFRGVVNDRRGTGRAARLREIEVAGKTGTAQVVRQEENLRDTDQLPEQLRDHAWFVAFAPVDDPVVSVVVLVEHGGHGGSAAAPLARRMLSKYFELYPLEEPGEEESPLSPPVTARRTAPGEKE